MDTVGRAGARPPLFTQAFVLLALADLAYFTGIGVAILVLPRYVVGPIGAGEAGAGLAFGAFGITALVCRPYAGRLADRYGRRWLLVGGALLCAAGMALLPLVSSLVLVVALRLLQGVAEAAFFVGGFALLADLAPAERMGEAISYNSLGLYLGFAFGPPLGEWVLEGRGFTAAWLVSAALVVGAGLVAAMMRGLPPRHESGGHGSLIHRASIPVAVAFLAALGSVGGFLAFGALHAERIGLSDSGLVMLAYGLVVVTCRLGFARVPDRLPHLPLAAVSLAVIGLGLLTMAVAGSPPVLLAGVVVMSVGVSFATPALFAAVFAAAGSGERGAAAGTASAAIDLALGLGPMVLGVVADLNGIPAALGVGSGIAFAGMLWAARLGRTRALHPAG